MRLICGKKGENNFGISYSYLYPIQRYIISFNWYKRNYLVYVRYWFKKGTHLWTPSQTIAKNYFVFVNFLEDFKIHKHLLIRNKAVCLIYPFIHSLTTRKMYCPLYFSFILLSLQPLFIYKRKMHIMHIHVKQKINAQNLRQCREY